MTSSSGNFQGPLRLLLAVDLIEVRPRKVVHLEIPIAVELERFNLQLAIEEGDRLLEASQGEDLQPFHNRRLGSVLPGKDQPVDRLLLCGQGDGQDSLDGAKFAIER